MSYPLEAARQLRSEELEDAKRALAEALAREAAAERALEEARAALEAHERGTRDAQDREGRLEARSVDDFLRGRAFLDRRASEAETLRGKVQQAIDTLGERRRATGAAREALAQARAQHEAVEKHYQRWLAERRRKAELRAEDEADELTSARHGR